MPAHKIISVGTDPELLWLRNAVLKSAGFEVATTERHDQALTLIQGGACGTLLMCYSLALRTRQLLAEAFRKHCPDGRIVAITNQRLEKPDFADIFVYGVDGPEALIDAIRRD
jgi:DNA-binding NtrC family response regulator